MKPRAAAKGGAQTIGSLTIARWQQAMKTDAYAYLIDGASAQTRGEVLAALDDPQREVRRVAARLAQAIGVDSTDETFATQALAKLRALGAEATKPAAALAAALEQRALRAALPWLRGFDPRAVPAVLAALDDARPQVRDAAIAWWWDAHGLAAPVFREVETKLLALRADAKRPLRQHIDLALEGLRAKHYSD